MHRNGVPRKINCFSVKEWTTCVLCLLILTVICIVTLFNSIIKPSTEAVQSIDFPILQMMDENINPCDDFYNFVCGNFVKNTIFPEGITVIKIFSQISTNARNQLKTLVEEPIQADDSKSSKLVKTVYQSCMDSAKIENTTLPFLKRTFKKVGGWPILETTWSEEKFNWEQGLQNFRTLGWTFDVLVAMQVDIDKNNSSRRILTISQPNLANSDILYKGINHSDNQAYLDYMVKTVSLFGVQEASAKVEMREVLEFEINLNEILAPPGYMLDPIYHLVTIEGLQENFGTISWLELIDDFTSPVKLSNLTVVNVFWPKLLDDLPLLLNRTKKRTLANYMFWCVVQKCISQMPREFRIKAADFYELTKNETAKPRWQQCIEALDKLHIAASAAYVEKVFPLESKRTVTEIAKYIQDAFVDLLRNVEWMDPETKNSAILKIEKMKLTIGFPDELLDEDIVEDYYRGLEFDPTSSYLEIYTTASLFAHQKKVRGLEGVINKRHWALHTYSYKPNGFYDPHANSAEISAAFLQDHYFDPTRPKYMNFATIGGVLGHEITHSIDNETKRYDEAGGVSNWWKPKAMKIFKEKMDCLIGQYTNMTVPGTGTHLNGTHTLDENIADNAGLKVTYKAYLNWLDTNKIEPLLSGLPYTARQMFWISISSNSCSKYRNEELAEYAAISYHAPEYFRVLLPLMNSEDFARDFNCAVGSVMNPEEKCHIW